MFDIEDIDKEYFNPEDWLIVNEETNEIVRPTIDEMIFDETESALFYDACLLSFRKEGMDVEKYI